jgi:hypothetical protein
MSLCFYNDVSAYLLYVTGANYTLSVDTVNKPSAHCYSRRASSILHVDSHVHIYDFTANVPPTARASLSRGHQSRHCTSFRLVARFFIITGPTKCADHSTASLCLMYRYTYLQAQVSGTCSGTLAAVLYDRLGIILKRRLS